MMKKIFLFLLLIISFVSYGQTYNPANFTVSNKSYGVAQAVPTDARSQFYDGTNFVMRDYQSTTEVNSYLNLAKYRTGHFLVYIHNGGSLSSGVWTGGTTDIYIYKDGVLDANLVPLFTNTTLSNTGSGFRIVKPISGSDYPLRSLASSNTIIWDSTSNSNSLTGKVDTSLIVTINRLSDTAASIRLAISAGGGGITTLTGDVTASGTGSVASTIANNAVSNAKFRQSAALSVVGRTSNSTGNVADIAAATSGHVLRRNGTTLDFGTIDSVSVPLLHSEAYYNTKYPAIGSDSVYVKSVGDSGLSLFYIQGDTLKFKRINGATQNADSSISVVGGSGGSQTFAQVLATGRTLPTNDSVSLSGKYFKFYGNSSNVTTESLYLGKRQFDNATNAGWYPLIIEPMSTDAKAPNWYWKLNQTVQTGTYPNNVMKMGWNPDLIQTNKMGLWDAWESYYSPGGGTDSILERHFSFQGQGTGEVRLASWTVYMRNGVLGDNQTTNILSNLDIRAETTNFLTTNNRSFASIAQNKTSKVSALTLQSGNGVALNLSVDSAQNLISFNQQFGPAPRAVSFFNDGATRDLNFYNFRITTNAGVEFQGYAGVNTDSAHDFGGYSTRFKRGYFATTGSNRQVVGNLAAWGNFTPSAEQINWTIYADNTSNFLKMYGVGGSGTKLTIQNNGAIGTATKSGYLSSFDLSEVNADTLLWASWGQVLRKLAAVGGTTLYTGDGSVSGNRTVTLGTNTFTFSSNSLNKFHIASNGKVSIGSTTNNGYDFNVNGQLGVTGTGYDFAINGASSLYWGTTGDNITRLVGNSKEFRQIISGGDFTLAPYTDNTLPYRIKDFGGSTLLQVNFATGETSLKKLIITNNDGETTPNGGVVFNGTFTGGTDAAHAIVNQRIYSRTTGAAAFIDDGGSSTVSTDHTISLQSRPSHTGGTLTTFHGVGVYPTVSSTGVATNIWNYTARSAVNNGTTTENVAYNVEAPTLAGSGAITNSYGLKVASLTNATNNYSIFTGTAQSYFGGTVRVPSGELILNDLSGTNNVPFTLGNTANNTYPSINYNAGLRANSGKFLVSDIALKMDMNATGFVFRGSNTGTAGGTITFTDLLTVPIGNAATMGNMILHNGQFQVNSNTPAYFGAKTSSDYPELTYNYDLRGNAYKITDEAYRFRLDNGFKFFVAASGTAGTAPTFTEISRLTDAGEFFLGSLTDNGAFTLQNTGGLYQQGSFRLGGTRAATANDVKLLVKGESDSTVAQLDFPIVQTSYSPTKTDVTNIGTASVTTSYYQRTGNKIEVWGEITIDPTATGDTQITLSLPIASSITNSYDLSGSAVTYDNNQTFRIYFGGGNAIVRGNASVDASSHTYSYRYVYYYIAP